MVSYQMRNQISTVAGIWIIISVFDSTDAPKTAGVDLIATENSVAAWVEDYQVDDDIDYEVASGLFSVCFRILARWILEAEELSCEHGCLRDYTDLLILLPHYGRYWGLRVCLICIHVHGRWAGDLRFIQPLES